MKQLVCYIFAGLVLLTPAALAQKVTWGDYTRNQAGLRINVKPAAKGSGVEVSLSTQNEDDPAWVPEKRKSCEMIISDASNFTNCKLVNKPKAQPLTFINKGTNNRSITSLKYVMDLDACTGTHTLIIDYSVVCKKGLGDNGKIEIPISIELQEEKDPIASSQQGTQTTPEDTLPKQNTSPPDENPEPDQTPDQGRDPVSNPSDSGKPPTVTENPPAQEDTATQEAGTLSPIDPPKEEPPQKPDQVKPKDPPPPEKKSGFPYYLLLVFAVLAAAGYWFVSKRKKKTPPPAPIERRPQTTAVRQQPARSTKPIQKQPSFAVKAIPKPQRSGAYTVVNLHNCWEDSSIHQVFLSKQLMQELDHFVTDQNVRPFHEDGVDAVPEIGGFILGQYKRAEKTGEWDVYLEKFKAITPGKSGVYRVSFETMAWAELAEIQDQYPSLQTLAWFHTHPGHGLFLSQPDLRIHNGFFKEKYQLAMEIDSLSEGLDTAFFSRKKSGEVNNRKDRISNRWFKWDQLMKTQKAHD